MGTKNNIQSDEIYITTRRASELYGRSKKWFELQRYQGLEPKCWIKVNTSILYDKERLTEWFRSHQI